MHPEAIKKLISLFSKLPTVGPRTAARFVFHLVKLPQEELDQLADSIKGIKEDIKICRSCFRTFDSSENPASWISFNEELFLIDVVNKTYQRIAHHRTRSPGYEEQPKASVSPDWTLVVFTSNMNRTSGTYAVVYSVTTGLSAEEEVPPNAIQGVKIGLLEWEKS